jgi:hypothetical protein
VNNRFCPAEDGPFCTLSNISPYISCDATPELQPVVREFFQLFKTPWEILQPDHVYDVAMLAGEAPFEVRFQVSDKSGRLLYFNIIIEGVNMLASERTEIGAMLDRQGGNLDALIAELQTT